MLELPRAVHDLPQRVVVIGANRLRLAVQVLVDGLGGSLALHVEVAHRPRVRGLVPDVLGHRRDLAQLVVREEVGAVLLVEREDHRLGVRIGSAHDVVREAARSIGRPVVLVGLDHVDPELHIA